jgi:hypothetical protein
MNGKIEKKMNSGKIFWTVFILREYPSIEKNNEVVFGG